MINTILYDLDGVLVDAVNIHKNAFIESVREITGVHIADFYHEKYLNGLPTKKKLDKIFGSGHIFMSDTERETIEKIKQSKTVDLINKQMFTDHQKRDLHTWAKNKGYKIACVTNCSRDTAELMLEKTGQLEFIDILITNKDVANHKPDPEPYLMAMYKLGVSSSQCLVVEDTIKGRQAGEAALCKVLMVLGPDEVNIQNIEKAIQ